MTPTPRCAPSCRRTKARFFGSISTGLKRLSRGFSVSHPALNRSNDVSGSARNRARLHSDEQSKSARDSFGRLSVEPAHRCTNLREDIMYRSRVDTRKHFRDANTDRRDEPARSGLAKVLASAKDTAKAALGI